MGKYFGTDGFRGEAGVTLNVEHAYKIGRFLGWYFSENGKKKVNVALGKDTRLSSYMFEYSLAAGLTASGADAYMLHVTTTPSVSFVVAADDFDCGVMISASHNPYYDNGIKIVNSKGEKISDEAAEKIELYIDGKLDELGVKEKDIPFATGENIGRIIDYSAGRNRYIGYLISLSRYSFKGFKVGLDCANGSAWMIAKSVFEAIGSKVYAIGNTPDGTNINNGVGSTHIEHLAEFIKEKELDIGFAFDGDADRCIAVDENGNVVNGDHILYILASRMIKTGELEKDTVVTTIMSNLGLYKAFDEMGIGYLKTQVGDRFVYEAMQNGGYRLGGEQSGHVIMSKYASTGDGILTAIKIMEAVIGLKMSLGTIASKVRMFPQLLKNIRVSDKNEVMKSPELKERIAELEKELDGNGRILVRASGTEPLVRIMVEAETDDLCAEYVQIVEDKMISLGLVK